MEYKPYPFHTEWCFGKGVLELVPPLIRGYRREECGLGDRICSKISKIESSAQGKPEGQGGQGG